MCGGSSQGGFKLELPSTCIYFFISSAVFEENIMVLS